MSMKFISTILFAIFLTTGLKATEKVELNFFGEMDRKMRVMIIGAPEGYEEAFAVADNQEIVDHQQYMQNVDEADLIILFIYEWVSAKYLDDSWEPEIKETLLNTPQTQLLQYFDVKNEQQEPLRAFVFYNRTYTDQMPLDCVAADVLNIFRLSREEYSEKNISHCL